MDDLSLPAVDSLRRAQNAIIEHSLDRISAEHPWYRTLPEAPRRQIDAVARLGVTMFVDSVETPRDDVVPNRIFSVAPAALTGTITLGQTLGLVRTVLDVVIEEAPQAVPAEDHDTVTILALTFGRRPRRRRRMSRSSRRRRICLTAMSRNRRAYGAPAPWTREPVLSRRAGGTSGFRRYGGSRR